VNIVFLVNWGAKDSLQSAVNDVRIKTSGDVLLLMRREFQPTNVIFSLLRSIEHRDIRHMPLATAVGTTFAIEGSSPIWALQNGQGIYVNPLVDECSKHIGWQKRTGKCCIGIFDNEVFTERCQAPRNVLY
jgi:hypothetical protein